MAAGDEGEREEAHGSLMVWHQLKWGLLMRRSSEPATDVWSAVAIDRLSRGGYSIAIDLQLRALPVSALYHE